MGIDVNHHIRSIRRVLIANNGNSAIKAIHSMRQWSLKSGKHGELEFVVMVTPEDCSAGAEYIIHGSVVVNVPGGSNHHNYANIDLIMDIAIKHHCDAIWPGWGHASENHNLPKRIEDYNSDPKNNPIKWIGPSSASMFALGDKIGSTIIAQTAAVPCVPWSGSHVMLSLPEGQSVTASDLKESHVNDASVSTWQQCVEVISQIGLPVMIKAADGGGGKGIRKVDEETVDNYGSMEKAVQQLYREVCNEVKNSAIFVMKMLTHCRHLEVQVMADSYGNAWALASRDCSIQRRCQKIIEEGPVVAAKQETIRAMEAAAARLCKIVAYESAATCEFLYDPQTESFYFLEVNARLQVEHVVTEMNTETNLPAAQLMVAMGYALEDIPDIKFAHECRLKGTLPSSKHVIAARITAEHAEEHFRPTCGSVERLVFRPSADVWGYFGITSGGQIHQFADSQFGHIFARGRDRKDAIKNCIFALKQIDVRGSIRTNIRALIAILTHSSFETNTTFTTWLDAIDFIPLYKLDKCAETKMLRAVVFGAVYRAHIAFGQSFEHFQERMSIGQVPEAMCMETEVSFVVEGYKFNLMVKSTGPNCLSLTTNGCCVNLKYHDLGDCEKYPSFMIDVPTMRTCRVVFLSDPDAETLIVRTEDGWEETLKADRDISQIRADVSGKLVRYTVEDGAYVVEGQAYAEVEVMKMFMQIAIPHGRGVFHQTIADGSTFKIGTLLGRLDMPEETASSQNVNFTSKIDLAPLKEECAKHVDSESASTKDDGICRETEDDEETVDRFSEFMSIFSAIMSGYGIPYDKEVSEVITKVVEACHVTRLPNELILRILSGSYDIDQDTKDKLIDLMSTSTPVNRNPPEQQFLRGQTSEELMMKDLLEMNDSSPVSYQDSPFSEALVILGEANESEDSIPELWKLLSQLSYAYAFNPQYPMLCVILQQIITAYLDVERCFNDFYTDKPLYATMGCHGTFTSAGIRYLRNDKAKDAHEIWQLCKSHMNYDLKNEVLGVLLTQVASDKATLHAIADDLVDLNSLALTKRYLAASVSSNQPDSPLMRRKTSLTSFFNESAIASIHQSRSQSDFGENANPQVSPFHVISALDLSAKRAICKKVESSYVYDFIPMLETAVKREWSAYKAKCKNCRLGRESGVKEHPCAPYPRTLFLAEEMFLNNGMLVVVDREPGMNRIGVVGWKIMMKTPTEPEGRTIILIANDLSYKAGSFGVAEDDFFYACSQLAKDLRVPRIHISCNSGARIGLDTSLSDYIQADWVIPDNHTKGFRFLYLTVSDYDKFKDVVSAELVEHAIYGKIYKLNGILGRDSGLGVENLAGSGKIAGETSRCYSDGFTLTYVTGRTVGIGAYLTRLGQRVIQKRLDSPILLTGFQALNKLIGRDVYKSNDDIGGVEVMFSNGISHQVADTDFHGMQKVVQWLSFVPAILNDVTIPKALAGTRSLQRVAVMDPVERLVEENETSGDPRHLLTGWTDDAGVFHGGIFDRGSFVEAQEDWAKGVVIARARLGGRSVGCIAVETRSTDVTQPADPAAPESREEIRSRPGQVWFPESAYKTAQAVRDFNNEELPLFILANWRGFSGGQRDMYNEILKFGSMIVDALVAFKNPIFVYIPPKAELRGGAWVVVDSNINPSVMEMYADPSARGGVIEPNACVEIRFREAKLDVLGKRLQRESLSRIDKFESPANTDPYQRVAEAYADLHDTPYRMKATKVIREIVPLCDSRVFFHGRLIRQEILFSIRKEIRCSVGDSFTSNEMDALIDSWATNFGYDFQDHSQMYDWVKHHQADIMKHIELLQKERIETHVHQNILGDALIGLADFL
eukprot:GHVH01009814.1.p1 GENE.GHVH01009814.1~~GHVH01009814.1.p1  ORF type:complete len:1827 (+),score=269.12 GHVH01009814.1:338-5818(+)